MKKETVIPVTKNKKSSPGSNPKNKFKKNAGNGTDSNIITGAVENVKAKSGRGLTNEGTNVDYNEER